MTQITLPRHFIPIIALLGISLFVTSTIYAEPGSGAENFKQLETELPTANVYRTAGGEPGPDYWQQSADYIINVELDEGRRHLKGSEIITYTNNAPTPLHYIWLQLDQNRFSDNSLSRLSETSRKDKDGDDRISYSTMRSIQ